MIANAADIATAGLAPIGGVDVSLVDDGEEVALSGCTSSCSGSGASGSSFLALVGVAAIRLVVPVGFCAVVVGRGCVTTAALHTPSAPHTLPEVQHLEPQHVVPFAQLPQSLQQK